ncbi:MAG: nucleoside recognition protein [Desulfobacterales bacterium]
MPAKNSTPRYMLLAVSLLISAVIYGLGIMLAQDLTTHQVLKRLVWPLSRLIIFITIGLMVGQIIELAGWTRYLASLAAPLFRFGNLGRQCSAAFTAAFFSGVAANAMLLDFYKDGKICRRELFLANFINQLPAYFLHLPTTFFIIIPLTGAAGGLYLLITLLAAIMRTFLFLIYGHLRPSIQSCEYRSAETESLVSDRQTSQSLWQGIQKKFPRRMTNILIYVVPIYIFIFFVNAMGVFDFARQWLAQYVVTTIIPIEALSLVILSFVAEFTSGFAAAGALLDAGLLTTKQTVLALLIGNIVAFPIRALRHQLPRYIGIFAPRMGTQLLLLGQGFRVTSILIIGAVYYFIG